MWRFPAFEHAVIADDPHAPEPRALRQIDRILEGLGIRLGTPGREQDEVTRHQNRFEDIPADPSAGIVVKAKIPGAVRGVRRLNPSSRPLRVDQGYRRRVADFGFVQSLLLERVAFRDAGVLRDLTAERSGHPGGVRQLIPRLLPR